MFDQPAIRGLRRCCWLVLVGVLVLSGVPAQAHDRLPDTNELMAVLG